MGNELNSTITIVAPLNSWDLSTEVQSSFLSLPIQSHVICNILLNNSATEKEIKIYDVPEWPTQVWNYGRVRSGLCVCVCGRNL